MESFYHALAKHYAMLFPARQAQVNCLAKLAGPTPARLIDIASGTGEYVAALGELGYECLGVELDNTMCVQARERHPKLAHRLVQGDMLELMDEVRGPAMLAFCIGNSLPHLADDTELATAISQMWDITRPAGKVVLQVVNYDRVLAQAVDGNFRLPILETTAVDGSPVVLKREYTEITLEKLRFSIWLITKDNEWPTERPMLVLTRQRIEHALPPGINAQWFGGFDLRPWDAAAPATIAVLG